MKKLLLIISIIIQVVELKSQTWVSAGSLSAPVLDLIAYNSQLHAAGFFIHTGTHVAAWDNVSWNPLGTDMNNPAVVMVDYSGQLLVGGAFDSAGGGPSPFIASYGGSDWYHYGNFDGPVENFAIYNGELFAGGSFISVDGNTVNYVARNVAGFWTTAGNGFDNNVEALHVYNGELYAAGNFNYSGGNFFPAIARWNGTQWNTVGAGLNGSVRAFEVYQGELYAGGFFTQAGGISASHIAKWDGTSWSPVGSGVDDDVHSMVVYNGELYVGGNFTTAGGIPAMKIARFDGTNWSALGSGMNGIVYSLVEFNSELYAGGAFTNAGGTTANYVAKLVSQTNVADQNFTSITFYPNPVTNILNIKSLTNTGRIESIGIYNALGEEISRFYISPLSTHHVSMDDYTQGIYFIHYENSMGEIIRMIITKI